LSLCVFVCPADDVRAEADHKQEGSGAAVGLGQPGHLPEPVGPAERHDGRRRAQPDGPARYLPAAPRHEHTSKHGKESRPFKGPVGQVDSCLIPSSTFWLPAAPVLCNKRTVRPLRAPNQPVHQGNGVVVFETRLLSTGSSVWIDCQGCSL